ncbi:hypothetical protein CAS74_001085 [Pichia kudriavzevii]|uniref:PA14 domain-containing protein n=1 Tax=Pichia kudriavzevii TaxID=4909 RepID=A0A1Z8JVT2_PICKU|nr:uncharacterized protein C5L36_0C10640 [Pichia kudriavzevii]AWU77159.1 hypothetical protein C5L36_0C10640 [Pichia kudriavzevii]OUT24695.1 hypothetical protein CAS74_001085 [Pichia kudriavzevii]
MFKNIYTLATVAFALLGLTEAKRNVVSSTANGSGAAIGVATYSTGFNARFFAYDGGDLIDFNCDDYVANSYALGKVRTSTSLVTEPNFSFGFPVEGEHVYDMYNINMWNVLVELQGYFVAPETGLYTVTFNGVNDGGFIWLGAGAFEACSQEINDNSYADVLLALRGDGAHSSFVYLEEGVMYPMRTTFINIFFDAVFDFEVVRPNGDIIRNFNETVINFDKRDAEVCLPVPFGSQVYFSTEVNYGSQYSTPSTSYGQTVTNGKTYVVENLYVAEPTSTITSTVTNSFAATTTITSYATSNGTPAPVVVVVDQTSIPESSLITSKSKLVTATISGQTLPQATGCKLTEDLMKKNPGFHASLFKYDGFFGFLDPVYYANDYTTEHLIGTAHNITSPNYSINACLFQTDDIYGAHLTSWEGYVAQLTGYIYASESGLYEFSIDYSDDGSMVWIGTNDAFACCQPDNIPYNSEGGRLIFAGDEEKVTGYAYLTEGYYYPVRVVMVNWYGDSALEMSMITPSGVVVKDDWSNWIVSVEDEQEGFCA